MASGCKVKIKKARRILEDARALCAAGIYSLVLEGIPADLAETITAEVDVPTIGIGAGPKCDGQVLVCYDFLGINMGFNPKVSEDLRDLGQEIQNATQQYISEVRDGTFQGRSTASNLVNACVSLGMNKLAHKTAISFYMAILTEPFGNAGHSFRS